MLVQTTAILLQLAECAAVKIEKNSINSNALELGADLSRNAVV